MLRTQASNNVSHNLTPLLKSCTKGLFKCPNKKKLQLGKTTQVTSLLPILGNNFFGFIFTRSMTYFFTRSVTYFLVSAFHSRQNKLSS